MTEAADRLPCQLVLAEDLLALWANKQWPYRPLIKFLFNNRELEKYNSAHSLKKICKIYSQVYVDK